MSTIKEVVFWLNQYKHIQRDIKDIELRITQLRLKYGTPSAISYSDMPKAHNGNRDLSEYAERLEELERELIDRHTAALGLSVQYLQALDHLDREEAYIIRRRYMDGAYMVTIADEIPCSERTVYYYYRRALRKLATLNIADQQCFFHNLPFRASFSPSERRPFIYANNFFIVISFCVGGALSSARRSFSARR